jgi:hypothetical protein
MRLPDLSATSVFICGRELVCFSAFFVFGSYRCDSIVINGICPELSNVPQEGYFGITPAFRQGPHDYHFVNRLANNRRS